MPGGNLNINTMFQLPWRTRIIIIIILAC